VVGFSVFKHQLANEGADGKLLVEGCCWWFHFVLDKETWQFIWLGPVDIFSKSWHLEDNLLVDDKDGMPRDM
jgi:hypothetical protein